MACRLISCPTATKSSLPTSGATSLPCSTSGPTCPQHSTPNQTARPSVSTRPLSSTSACSVTTSKTTGKTSCPAPSLLTTTLCTLQPAIPPFLPITVTILSPPVPSCHTPPT